MTRRYAGIILAAGLSSRMGRSKPLLPFGDETLIERQIRLFHRAGVERVYVVSGHGGEELLPYIKALKAKAVFNPDYAGGMFTSVRAGVAALCSEGAGTGFFILPVDYALVPPLALVLQMEAHEKTQSPVVFPSFNLRRGHPPLMDGRLAGSILDHGGGEGLNGVLKHMGDVAHIAMWDGRVRMDADTPQDYEAALRVHSETCILDAGICGWLHDTFHTSPNVLAHCQAVARVADLLSGRLADLLPGINPAAIRCAALIHDIKKGAPRHDEAGAQLLELMDYPGTAEMIRHHMGLPAGWVDSLTNATLLYYADKITQGAAPLPLALRRARIAASDERAAFAAKRLDDAQRIEEQLRSRLGVKRFSALMDDILAS